MSNSATPWTVAHQALLSSTITWGLLKFMSIELVAICPSLPLPSPSSLAFNLSRHQGLFQWVSSSHQMAKGVELQLQHQSLQWILRIDFLYDWLVWSPCIPRDSHESSPAPQFKSINFLVLSLLYGPTLTPIHDYQKNHSFNRTDLGQQSDVFAF